MRSKRRHHRLHVSSHAHVRSPRARHAWIASLHQRVRPRVVVWRWRGCSVLCGRSPAVTMHVRWRVASTPPSRLRSAPFRSNPPSLATGCKAWSPFGNSPMAVSWTGAPERGATTSPGWSVIAMLCSPCWGVYPAYPRPSPRVAPRCWSRRPAARVHRASSRPRAGPHAR
jgi:hypothetical protein